MKATPWIAFGLTIGAVACGDGGNSGEACFATTLDPARCDPATTTFSLSSTNRYYPLHVGSVTILEGIEDGVVIRVERRVLAETQVVAGVTTHVLEAKEFMDGAIYEIARNFYVEAADGTVCYFGEDVEFFDGGVVVNTDGSWRAGVGTARPGIIMPASPRAGDAYYQEVAPGIAEDMARVVSTDSTMVLAGTSYTDVATIMDSNPIDDETPCAEEQKFYAPGVGEAADTVKTLVSFTPGT